MRNTGIIFFVLSLFLFTSCENDAEKSDKKEIISFNVKEQIDSTNINTTSRTIEITVASNANLKKLCPSIVISEKASVKPASGDTVDFSSKEVTFTVTAEDNSTQIWTVKVNQNTIPIVPDLNQKLISSLVIDKSNTKWIGTESGLYKSVDGGYTLMDVTSGMIISLSYDANSNVLWVGTVNGLSKVTISGSDITGAAIASSNLSSSMVNASYTDIAARVWLGTDLGISMCKSGNYKKADFMTNELGDMFPLEFADTKVNSITYWDGDYYFATGGMGVFRAYDYDATVDAFTGASQLDAPYNGEAITDTMFVVFSDSKGRQWMGGTAGLQAHTGHDTKDPGSYKFYYDKLPDTKIHAVAEAKDGKIWVGTEKGLAILSDTIWTTRTESLPNLFVTAIAFDADGSAWVGTKKGLVNIK